MASHNISTIADLVDLVTLDNIEELRTDLGDFLSHVLIAKTLYGAATNKPATAAELGLVSLKWKPDGKRQTHTVMRSNEHRAGDPEVHIKSKPNGDTELSAKGNLSSD